jgi:hypothetical protein
MRTEELLLRHTEILSSDEFEGRAPGTPGEERTVAYIAERMREVGLGPGGADGGWFQAVPLIGMRSKVVHARCGEVTLEAGADLVAWSRHPASEVSLEGSEVVFAGHGSVAPGRPDYGGLGSQRDRRGSRGVPRGGSGDRGGG